MQSHERSQVIRTTVSEILVLSHAKRPPRAAFRESCENGGLLSGDPGGLLKPGGDTTRLDRAKPHFLASRQDRGQKIPLIRRGEDQDISRRRFLQGLEKRVGRLHGHGFSPLDHGQTVPARNGLEPHPSREFSNLLDANDPAVRTDPLQVREISPGHLTAVNTAAATVRIQGLQAVEGPAEGESRRGLPHPRNPQEQVCVRNLFPCEHLFQKSDGLILAYDLGKGLRMVTHDIVCFTFHGINAQPVSARRLPEARVTRAPGSWVSAARHPKHPDSGTAHSLTWESKLRRMSASMSAGSRRASTTVNRSGSRRANSRYPSRTAW